MSHRENEIITNLKQINDSITRLNPQVTLVVVSKTFPETDIRIAYEAGQRHFGENYAQELISKSRQLPKDIQWHYIGALQSNKLKSLLTIENLIIETLDSADKARQLNELIISNRRLVVYIQVNTSQEDQKHGICLDDAIKLAIYIHNECPKLILGGLMTIGAAQNAQIDKNPDFRTLLELCYRIATTLQIAPASLQLSMGMSNDYEQAIKQGSTSVRVGSAIFGSRTRHRHKV